MAQGPNINNINRLKGWGAKTYLLRTYCVSSTVVVKIVVQGEIPTARVKFILEHTDNTSAK